MDNQILQTAVRARGAGHPSACFRRPLLPRPTAHSLSQKGRTSVARTRPVCVCQWALWAVTLSTTTSVAHAQWGKPFPGTPAALAASAAPAASAPALPPLVSGSGIPLKMIPGIQPLPGGEAGKLLPITVKAQKMRGRPDIETVAEGDAVMHRGDLSIRADLLSYDHVEDLALARGNVRIRQGANRYSGPELQMKVQRYEGYFLNPTYFFGATGASGVAERIDFVDNQRSVATDATYSSCPADAGDPDWVLSSARVRMDFESNEGIAEGAVLRFLGVPILASPLLSFPLSSERKSGWLPPSLVLDNRAGVQLQMPWYWNIAPNRDATITPLVSTKRGLGIGGEFRYLESDYRGQLNLDLIPHDRVEGRDRYSIGATHEASWPGDTELKVRVLRVSDDNYWKDFPNNNNDQDQLTPRLLLSDIRLSRPFGDWTTYARAQSWQALQDSDSQFTNPYERLPQVGARTQHQLPYGMQMGFELEFNHFVNPEDTTPSDRVEGSRLHSLMSVSRPWISPGWTITPKVSMNAATYSLDQEMADGRKEATRVIPTLSVDSAWTLERDTALFGKEITQTLEPRIFYVYTPYRDQNDLPNFDAAGKTITPYSLFSENAFSGVDRVSDANQVTTGLTTRLLDSVTSGELVRLGILQSFLFSEQKVTPNGQPQERGFSDILLFASTNVIPHWSLNGETQYNPGLGKFETSTAGAAYSPGAFRTVALNYRYTREQSEQIEMGWQWPLFGRTPDQMSAMGNPRDCSGALYSVGRGNYSIRDKRLIDSLLGFEYDAGCWIARVVMNRQSTGQAQATTQVMFQLELVGLSRIGANPLAVLKQNIPGYRLLRDGPPVPQISSTYD